MQIEYGFRFYGYQEDSGECSHAATIQSSEHEVLTSLIFTFKTEAESGVLLYKRHDVSILLATFRTTWLNLELSLTCVCSSSVNLIEIFFHFGVIKCNGKIPFFSLMQETFSLFMVILHGDLLMWLGDVKSSPVFSSSDGAFSDNSWRVLRVALTADR